MKAAQIATYGGPEVIEVIEVELPELKPEQVLVEVYASCLNPWDTKVRDGSVQAMIPLKLPVTLGGDIAGVIQAVGTGVTDFKVGDRVFGTAGTTGGASGALAEMAAVNSSQLALLPAKLSFVEAAASVLTGTSALQALLDHAGLQAGQKLLIHGGSGGIGSVAIQIAKNLGAYVATTASGNGLDFVRSLGADEVIDYKSQDFTEAIHDYDVVFDTVAGETYEKSYQVLKPGGLIVSMNAQPLPELEHVHQVTAIHQQTQVTKQQLMRLADYLARGVITIHVDKTFPLDQIRAAFTARESGQIQGKVAIQIKA